MQLLIREETLGDRDAIRTVNESAFGQPNEARLVEGLREDALIVASLVGIIDGQVVGNVVFSDLPVETATGSIDAVALAPVAVRPEFQRRGIGSALIEEGLRLCKSRSKRVVFVLGDPAYYTRFGFSAALAERIKSPFSGSAWMAVELTEGVLNGVEGTVTYPDAFDEVA